jgi:hypothetical protein
VLLPGPCPPWCACAHDDDHCTEEEDPEIMHISDALVWDMPLNRTFPTLHFDLVAFEDTQECGRRSWRSARFRGVEPTSPASFDVDAAAGLDRVISELERTIEQLRAWRIYLP